MKREARVILVVEDNPTIVEAIERAGQELDLTTHFASDGWEAIERLEETENDYAAIIIDTDLPRHSGFGVLTYLHEEVGQDLDNVIVMTSSDHEQLRRKLSERVTVVGKTDVVAAITRAIGE
jgi:CheY-like chemotaxis protein